MMTVGRRDGPMLDPTRLQQCADATTASETDGAPKEGDALEHAFACFYARYFGPVHAMARKCTASEDHAQRLTETIMIRALECFSPDRATADVDAAVFRIARAVSCGRSAHCAPRSPRDH